MTYAESVAPGKPAHPGSLDRTFIAWYNIDYVIIPLSVDNTAPDRTEHVHADIKLYTYCSHMTY